MKWLAFIILLVPVFVNAQFKKIKSLEVDEQITFATVDRPGDLYVVLNSFAIQKYTTDGLLMSTLKNTTQPTLFDPRDGARLFSYTTSTQSYQLLNPSLEETTSVKIDQAFAIAPYLACMAGDQYVLIIDSTDWSLKKVDLRKSAVVQETSMKTFLPINAKIIFLREYQNFIFMLDQNNGILILNSMCKLIKTISVKNLSYFNFLGEELYYLESGHLKFVDLFTAETRTMELPEPCNIALLTDERLYLIQQNQVSVFSIQL